MDKNADTRVAVVILNWNGAAMLQRFLPSVVENTEAELADVIVADNASTDNSLEVLRSFPSVQVLRMEENYGFAGGYQRSLRELGTRYAWFLLLNSDIMTPPGWLRPMVDYMDAHPDVAACQPKLLAEHDPESFEYAGAAGGYIDSLGYPFCRGRVFDVVEKDCGQYDSVADVFWATGAALLIRAEDYWAVGGLDSRFFAHQEEIDLCWRLRARGRRIVCVPASHVYHVGGGTLPKENPHKTFLNFRNNMLLLYKNLPADRLWKVMLVRFWLDALASLVFLMKGETGSSLAVWRGRRAFWKMRKDFAADRRTNLAATTVNPIPEMLRGSLLVHVHLLRHRLWSQICEQ